mmetsp:Transcript_44247/g.111478  ORF Transcript_44247/g.111478 Transcript_44247/m.111478 type:complete len:205 (+) Transcript_44247:1134-1748(+)
MTPNILMMYLHLPPFTSSTYVGSIFKMARASFSRTSRAMKRISAHTNPRVHGLHLDQEHMNSNGSTINPFLSSKNARGAKSFIFVGRESLTVLILNSRASEKDFSSNPFMSEKECIVDDRIAMTSSRQSGSMSPLLRNSLYPKSSPAHSSKAESFSMGSSSSLAAWIESSVTESSSFFTCDGPSSQSFFFLLSFFFFKLHLTFS